MELESPADAWYVWFGVAIVSVAIAGVALALPSGPPPDTNEAANTIDRVTASPYDASATYEHDAEEVRIDATRISMRNDHGTTHATLAYGELVPVMDDDALENVTHGASSVDDEFPDAKAVVDAIDARLGEHGNEWYLADGTLVVRSISWDAGDGSVSDPEDEADDRSWLEYDRKEDTFHATIVVV